MDKYDFESKSSRQLHQVMILGPKNGYYDCECGSTFLVDNLARHLSSKKHEEYLINNSHLSNDTNYDSVTHDTEFMCHVCNRVVDVVIKNRHLSCPLHLWRQAIAKYYLQGRQGGYPQISDYIYIE